MKQFVFLYPIPQIMDWLLEMGVNKDTYLKKFKLFINQCIDVRYRQKGFAINYAIFNDTEVSDVIEQQPKDRVIKVGLDFKKHTTKKPNGKYPYPSQNYILKQLGNISMLRIGGFHIWDCVEKLARTAYRRGIDTLVDEDLTELFVVNANSPNFRIDKYPTYDPRGVGDDSFFKFFMKARKNKPWLWQDY